LGNRFTGGDFSESGSYLGIPLLLLTIFCCIRYRRNRWVLFATGLVVIAYVLSLGPTLVVAAHQTSVPLPFDLIGRLPLLEDILPVRFSLYQMFFVAVIVAFGIRHALHYDALPLRSQITAPSRAHSPGMAFRYPKATRRPLQRTILQLILVALLAATVVALIPTWPISTVGVKTGMPSFFVTPAADQIPNGSVVLTYPFPSLYTDQAMLWQQTDRWRWKLTGGEATLPYANNQTTAFPPVLQPVAVQEFLIYWSASGENYFLATPPPVTPQLVTQVRLYVRWHQIGSVIVDRSWPQAKIVVRVLERALGQPISRGGVDIWLHAQAKAASPTK
jgi:hypothetical protein